MGTQGITYKQEFLSTIERDIKDLISDHWDEVGFCDDLELDPDWDKYAKYEEFGSLKVFSAREDEKLVAYLVVLVDTHVFHKGVLFAYHNLFFVHPDYRHSWIAMKLLKFTEKCLREDGVQYIIVNTTIKKPMDALLSKFDYRLIEREYIKGLVD